ncbi:MAG: DUF4359 domain-containing protein [Chlorobi bacterium]|nr:DUF4359 domain-containing protein [Chlorobiota bacterium]
MIRKTAAAAGVLILLLVLTNPGHERFTRYLGEKNAEFFRSRGFYAPSDREQTYFKILAPFMAEMFERKNYGLFSLYSFEGYTFLGIGTRFFRIKTPMVPSRRPCLGSGRILTADEMNAYLDSVNMLLDMLADDDSLELSQSLDTVGSAGHGESNEGGGKEE